MSALTVQQIVASLHDVLPQVDGQTSADTAIGDRSNLKKTYVDWIAVAVATSQAASKTSPELPKLDQLQLALQYRTQQLQGEAPTELAPLIELFRNLAVRLFPSGIPEEFAERQLGHLCKKYPAFAKKLLEPSHETLAIDFFRFCLQAPSQSSHRGKDVSHWVELFVKYPEIAERLMRSSLYEKLGRFPENVYVDSQKGVCIKMDLFNVNADFVHITPSGVCIFKNKALGGNTRGITLTIEQIFQQFESPTPPDIDVSSAGIINFNPLLLESKDSDGKVYQVDPMKWTEYMPSVELDLNEMTKLFPAARSQTPFTFVLRVNSSAACNSQTFFDFIMKLDNGNYRVISLQSHQKQSSVVQQQKSFFYPLTPEQGKRVIQKVADEICRFRQANVEGKPIPPIDVQSYLDDILGHDFYAYLDRLVSKPHTYLHHTNEELKTQLAEVRKNLNTAAFEEFLRPVIDKLMSTHDMALIHQFITNSLATIHSVLQKDATKIRLPTEQEVTAAGKSHLDKMGPSLVALASLCFEVLHPYKMSVAAAEKNTPVIGFIFRRIESIPWVWLKNLLYNFFLTILGPFRGYHYKAVATSHLKTFPRLIQSIRNLAPERYINRPSQLFDSLSDAQKQAIEARIQGHLTVLTAPLT